MATIGYLSCMKAKANGVRLFSFTWKQSDTILLSLSLSGFAAASTARGLRAFLKKDILSG